MVSANLGCEYLFGFVYAGRRPSSAIRFRRVRRSRVAERRVIGGGLQNQNMSGGEAGDA
jgi:hypothetical protein